MAGGCCAAQGTAASECQAGEAQAGSATGAVGCGLCYRTEPESSDQ